MRKIISIFNKLSTAKKMLLLIFFIFALFSLLWWFLMNYIFYYASVTYGIPVISEFTGISSYTIEWLMFSLPLYFNIFIGIIVIIVISLLYKKKKSSNK